MFIIRIIVGALLAVFAMPIMVGNWHIFIVGAFLRRKTPSWIPIFGGLAGALAIIIAPVASLRRWWWVPLVLDWGSLPGIAHALIWHALRLWKSDPNG